MKLYKQGKGYNLILKGINFMWKISKIRRSSKEVNNVKKAIIILLVFVLGFLSASFFSSQYSKNLHFQQATLPSFSEILDDKNESIYIISPKDGDQVTNPVRIIFGLKGMGVAPAGTIKKNTGHHHLLINLEKLPDLKFPLPLNKNLIHFGLGQTETEVRLKKGINTLQLILGDHMHMSHQPPLISKKVKIIVK